MFSCLAFLTHEFNFLAIAVLHVVLSPFWLSGSLPFLWHQVNQSQHLSTSQLNDSKKTLLLCPSGSCANWMGLNLGWKLKQLSYLVMTIRLSKVCSVTGRDPLRLEWKCRSCFAIVSFTNVNGQFDNMDLLHKPAWYEYGAGRVGADKELKL